MSCGNQYGRHLLKDLLQKETKYASTCEDCNNDVERLTQRVPIFLKLLANIWASQHQITSSVALKHAIQKFKRLQEQQFCAWTVA